MILCFYKRDLLSTCTMKFIYILFILVNTSCGNTRKVLSTTRLFGQSIPNLNSNRNNGPIQNVYQFSYDPPPYYPLCLEDLVADSTFALKSALISRINRIRIDLNIRICKRERFMMEWLLLFTYEMLNEEFTRIHIFVDDEASLLRAKMVWEEKVINNTLTNVDVFPKTERNRIGISPLTDVHLTKEDKLIIIYNPNNIINQNSSVNVLEEVQALCFHSALRNIPVVIINPMLIATAWNDYGARSPLLLSDFSQAYFISDNYFMLSKEKFCGVIQRASGGLDLFVLDGLRPGNMYPKNYTRIETWPSGIPDSLTSALSRALAREPNFPLNMLKNITSSIKNTYS